MEREIQRERGRYLYSNSCDGDRAVIEAGVREGGNWDPFAMQIEEVIFPPQFRGTFGDQNEISRRN
mgnify:FL=1